MSDIQSAIAEAITLAPERADDELLAILDAGKIADMLSAHRRGERGPVYLVCVPKYAPNGTQGWVYTVEKINKTTVSLMPVGGGRGLRADPFTLVEAAASDLRAYAKLRGEEVASLVVGIHTGSVVRIAGDGWKQPETALWVVTALKGMTDVAIARLGGEDSGRIFPKIPRSYITATIAPQGLAAAMAEDERFA